MGLATLICVMHKEALWDDPFMGMGAYCTSTTYKYCYIMLDVQRNGLIAIKPVNMSMFV